MPYAFSSALAADSGTLAFIAKQLILELRRVRYLELNQHPASRPSR